MKKLTLTYVIVLLLNLLSLIQPVHAQNDSRTLLLPFATGLTAPVCIANAGDSRLFVVNQQGTIQIIDSNGNINPRLFLDFRKQVIWGGEQGLLGLAFHPQYSSNGYFYITYTGPGDSLHLSRLTVMSSDPEQADPQSELKLYTVYHPFTNHNGGDVHFGPDGYLYVSLGDGGSGGDPGNRAQNLRELLGKILRLDVDHGDLYSIPPTNPFYNSDGARGEIWAYGLRNPWRFSFDLLTGDMWIGDVGQNAWEEIDFQPAGSQGGENYGWHCYEGFEPYNTSGCMPASEYIPPVYAYPHGEECSLTGGYVYRANSESPYYGYYFYADYCSDRIWTLHFDGSIWVSELAGQFPDNNFSTFGEDYRGQLYIAGLTSGIIYKVAGTSAGVASHETKPCISVVMNPFSDRIRITQCGDQTELLMLTLLNSGGTKTYMSSTRQKVFEFNTTGFSPGVYFLNITTSEENIVYKLVKTR